MASAQLDSVRLRGDDRPLYILLIVGETRLTGQTHLGRFDFELAPPMRGIVMARRFAPDGERNVQGA